VWLCGLCLWGAWRAYTMFTCLDELKGFPPKVVHNLHYTAHTVVECGFFFRSAPSAYGNLSLRDPVCESWNW
jgi:hypothetical protein